MSKKFRVAILSISFLALAACGGGGSGGNDPTTPTTPDPVIPGPSNNDVKVNSQSDAAKFLNRATFGPHETVSISSSTDLLIKIGLTINSTQLPLITCPKFKA